MLIGESTAKIIHPNDSMVIASGTTVVALSKALQPRESLTVITSALNVALELLRHKDIEILQLGGVVRKSSSSVVGPYSEHILDDFFYSTFFLGVDGIDLEFGLTTTNSMEAHLNRQMNTNSQKTVWLSNSQ